MPFNRTEIKSGSSSFILHLPISTIYFSHMKNYIIIFIIALLSVSATNASEFFKNKYYNISMDWQTSETDHFKIVFTEHSKNLLPIAAQFAEDAYDFCSDTVGEQVSGTITLILFPSPHLFTQNSIVPSILPPNVAGFSTFEKDRVVVPFNGDLAYFQELLYHEIMHIFEYYIIYKNPLTAVFAKKHNVPSWIFEGLSEYATNNKRNPKYMTVRDAAMSGNLHPADYFAKNEALDYLAYQQAYSMILFLVDTWGEKKLRSFLKELTISLDADVAFEKTYGTSFNDIYARWKSSIMDTIQKNDTGFPSIFSDKTSILDQGYLYIPFKDSKFYITFDKNTIVRKMKKDDHYDEHYKEVLFQPSVFTYIDSTNDHYALSPNETIFSYAFFENGGYNVGIYNFASQTNSSKELPDITGIYKIFFADDKLLVLARKGTDSVLFDVTDEIKELPLPDKAISGIASSGNGKFAYVSHFGYDSYLFIDDLTHKISGTIIDIDALTSSSYLLLINEGMVNRLYHFNVKDGSLTPFTAYRETMTSFTISGDRIVGAYFYDQKSVFIDSPIPDYTQSGTTPEMVLKTPDITDSVNYDYSDMNPVKFRDPLVFSQTFFGMDISEGNHVQLRTGMLFDSILNEHQLYAYVGFFVTDAAPLDFGVAYITSGNRPAYSFWAEKHTLFRNDDLFYLNEFTAKIHYPLSFFGSVHAKAGAYLYGNDPDALNNALFAGIYSIYDSAYGRLYPDYGTRLYGYAGYVTGDNSGYECEADARLYYAPFMLRGYFRHSPMKYNDSTYIRGFQEIYYATTDKLTVSAEIRTPLISILPLFYSSVRLPNFSLYMFGDLGVFSNDITSVTVVKKVSDTAYTLQDAVMSYGFGFTIHVSNSLALDLIHVYTNDHGTESDKPKLEFSITKTFF